MTKLRQSLDKTAKIGSITMHQNATSCFYWFDEAGLLRQSTTPPIGINDVAGIGDQENAPLLLSYGKEPTP